MNLEREVKLEAPAGFRLPDLSVLGIDARVGATQRYATVYVDTPDLRLVRWGLSLRHREGEGWTLKLPVDDGGGLLTRHEITYPGERHRVPPEAGDLVQGVARGERLVPVTRLRTVRRTIVLSSGEGLLGTLTDDEVSVMDGRRLASRFREIEIELAPDAPAESLAPLVGLLRSAGGGPVANVPKLVRALGARAQDPELTVPEIGPDAAIQEVVRRALALSVQRLIRHDPGVRLGYDPEDIHQARVATRRLRSHLRSFRAEVDPAWSASLREELRWLGGLLGEVRDAEVLRDRLREKAEAALPEADQAAAADLVARLDRQRAEARDRLLAAMRAPRYPALIDRLVEAGRAPAVLEDVARLPAAQTLHPVVRAPWKHLRNAIQQVLDAPTNESLHGARIRAKRLRYAAEALAPVFGEPARAFALAAAALQDVLGEHQDAVVASAWLRQATRSGGRAQAFAAGELALIEAEAQAAARAAWPAAWKVLAGKRTRFWK